MPPEALLKWTSLAMPLVLGVSTLIAVMVYRFTRRQARMEALKIIHSRWHDLNRILMESPSIQRLVGGPRFASMSDEDVIVYNFLFQVIDICYELHLAKRHGLIDARMADRYLTGNLQVLLGRRKEALDILSWNHAYEDDFRRLMQARLGSEMEPLP